MCLAPFNRQNFELHIMTPSFLITCQIWLARPLGVPSWNGFINDSTAGSMLSKKPSHGGFSLSGKPARKKKGNVCLHFSCLTLCSLLPQQWEIIYIPPLIRKCTYTCAYIHTCKQREKGQFSQHPQIKTQQMLPITLRSPQEWGKWFFPQFYSLLYHPASVQLAHYTNCSVNAL